MIERSAFDEKFLGVACFRLKPPIVEDDVIAICQLDGKDPCFVDTKLDASDIKTARRLLEIGFRKVCTQICLTHPLTKTVAASEKVRFGDHLELPPETIEEHAAHFVTSRFRQDPQIDPERSDSLYAQWITNSLGGRKRVVSIGRNFCTYADNGSVRSIDLLSVLDKRQGYAHLLLSALAVDAKDLGLDRLETVTETENGAAVRAYIKAGFTT